jgi:magnesium-transporting ATPase (P-type)
LKVGDIAKIKTGLAIPCDAILVPDSTGVLCDEAAMTGESEECKKDIPENCLLKRKEFLEDETSPQIEIAIQSLLPFLCQELKFQQERVGL